MNFTSANWKFILKLYIYLHEVKQRQEITTLCIWRILLKQ